MSGIPHDHYEPKSNGEKWLHARLPIVGLLYDTLMIPTPKNLNWMWIWGAVLTFCLAFFTCARWLPLPLLASITFARLLPSLLLVRACFSSLAACASTRLLPLLLRPCF